MLTDRLERCGGRDGGKEGGMDGGNANLLEVSVNQCTSCDPACKTASSVPSVLLFGAFLNVHSKCLPLQKVPARWNPHLAVVGFHSTDQDHARWDGLHQCYSVRTFWWMYREWLSNDVASLFFVFLLNKPLRLRSQCCSAHRCPFRSSYGMLPWLHVYFLFWGQ